MGGDVKAPLSVVVPTLCTITPPSLFLVLGKLSDLLAVDWRKYEVAGCIVFAWTVAICYRMRVAWRSGICRACEKGIVTSIIQHPFVLVLGGLFLDGGFTLYACILTSMFYWMITGVVVAHRPISPTPFDIFLVTRGYPWMAFAMTLIFWTCQAIRGY